MLDKINNELGRKLDLYFATLERLLRGAEVTDRNAQALSLEQGCAWVAARGARGP